ncbi:TPA: hypothetical protein MHS23_26115 [Klebsiella pneumoniae]|nr:hypothetical protein [Klebsiella pneumoniae]
MSVCTGGRLKAQGPARYLRIAYAVDDKLLAQACKRISENCVKVLLLRRLLTKAPHKTLNLKMTVFTDITTGRAVRPEPV